MRENKGDISFLLKFSFLDALQITKLRNACFKKWNQNKILKGCKKEMLILSFLVLGPSQQKIIHPKCQQWRG